MIVHLILSVPHCVTAIKFETSVELCNKARRTRINIDQYGCPVLSLLNALINALNPQYWLQTSSADRET